MQKHIPLESGRFYHIYNRGINGEDIFKEKRNYAYFLQLYSKYIEPVADTYAYCLLKNHFHFLISIKEESLSMIQNLERLEVHGSRQFSHLFNSYAQAINKAYQRTGSLFQKPFRRKLIDSDIYFSCMVYYIHANPQKHGFLSDFRKYPYSSYHTILRQRPTKLKREAVLEWFGGRQGYLQFHQMQPDLGSVNFLEIEMD